jgi:hypothetical protein
MRNLSDQICREDQNTHFTFNKIVFRKSCPFLHNVEKYGRDRQITDDSIIRRSEDAICVPDNLGKLGMVFHCNNGYANASQCHVIRTLLQWYVYMFSIVTVVRVHVLYCVSGTPTCFVLLQWYVYMFCIVTVARLHVFVL